MWGLKGLVPRILGCLLRVLRVLGCLLLWLWCFGVQGIRIQGVRCFCVRAAGVLGFRVLQFSVVLMIGLWALRVSGFWAL